MPISFTLNGKAATIDADPDMPLLWAIREVVGLHGTKFGCGAAQCGACTVHIEGQATRSCITPISSVADQHVTTIEGLMSKPAKGVGRPSGAAMRLLPVRPDHVGGSTARAKSQADRCRHQ
jgi:isoquinoline 1-oxidoreductase alpha subunit